MIYNVLSIIITWFEVNESIPKTFFFFLLIKKKKNLFPLRKKNCIFVLLGNTAISLILLYYT